jgi:hypothetical protein
MRERLKVHYIERVLGVRDGGRLLGQGNGTSGEEAEELATGGQAHGWS